MKFAIAGYYGFGNVGDEAVLESIVADLRREFPGSAFDIICANYQATISGPDISTVLYTDWPSVVESVQGCDWLILGGGGLFNCYLEYSEDDFLRESRSFAAFIFGLPVLAFLMGKPSAIYGVGASRFNSPTAFAHARMAIRLADLCTVRDRESRRIIASSVWDRFRIRVHADPAFRLESKPLPKAALCESGIGVDEAVVGVVLRNWSFDADPVAWEPALAEALRNFALCHSVRLLFIPFQSSSDVENELSNDPAIIARMRTRIGKERTAELAPGLRPGEISAVVARCQMVIAMRLHGSILSARNATAFVALAYEPKVRNVLSACGLEEFVTGLPDDPDRIRQFEERLETIWAGKERISQLLRKAAHRLAIDAGVPVELLRRAVERPARRRRLNAETAEFLAQIGSAQSRRLAKADAARRAAATEATSLIAGIRQLVGAGKSDAALTMLEAWNPTTEENIAEREYLLGFCLQVLGAAPEDALKHYDHALQSGFDEFWVLYNRGQLLMSHGATDAALEDLTRASLLRPDDEGAAQLLEQWRGTGSILSETESDEQSGAPERC